MIHAVDTENLGVGNDAVVYTAACPTTSINKDYIKSQLQSSLAGLPLPDYVIGLETLMKRSSRAIQDSND
jgi:hypothetical protein